MKSLPLARPDMVDDYISHFPWPVQAKLNEVRAAIQAVVPHATECISYAMPTFKLRKNLVHFAGYPNHIGFYPGSAAILAFAKEISGFRNGKGSIQFPLDRPIPLDLIQKIVLYHVAKQEQSHTNP